MITEVLESILVRPRRGLGDLYPDVVIEEAHDDALEVTSHPVEGGAAISDHAYRQPAGLTIRAAVSDSSMRGLAPDYAVAVGRQGRLTDSDSSDSAEFYARLLELQRAREPFDIVTGKRLYKNMLLTRLSTVTDAASENILSFTAECREVIIVETRLAAVPPARLHQDPPRTGRAKDRGQVQSKEVGSSVINKMFG